MPEPLLEVRDLHVSFPTEDGVVKAVDGVSFSVMPGESLGVVGESGSGKSVTFLTVMGLVGSDQADISGEILYEGQDLLTLSKDELKKFRGAKISMIFQDPLTSLHPFYKVGDQIAEMITTHEDVSKKEALARAVEMLDRVRIAQPDRRAKQYPHEFSGGMRQRVMIAIALVNEPRLLIADEPTTALDVTVQAQILWLLRDLQQRLGLAVIFVTHDLGVAAEIADDAAVMYAGRIVEQAPIRELFRRPAHPYTEGLMQATVRRGQKGRPLVPIPGTPPNLMLLPAGCAFAPRCPIAVDTCLTTLPLFHPVAPGHVARCHLVAERLVSSRATPAIIGSRSSQGGSS